MEITLSLFDRNGIELNFGDIVKVSDGKHFTFFAEVKWIEAQKVIAPFHTFCFHSFVKIDKLPDGLEESKNPDYKVWYFNRDVAEEDQKPEDFEDYLRGWRELEIPIETRCFRINVNSKNEYGQAKLF